jgi:hypothetical protein
MRNHFYLIDMMALQLSPPLFFGLQIEDFPDTFINSFPRWPYQTPRPRRTEIKPVTDNELRTALLESLEDKGAFPTNIVYALTSRFINNIRYRRWGVG